MKSFSFENCNVLLTGGTGEIGHGFLTALSKYSIGKIFLPGSDKERLNHSKKKFTSLDLQTIYCDLTEEVGNQTLIDALIRMKAKFDLVIFGAGMLGIKGLEEFPTWDNALKIHALNVLSPAFCFKKLVEFDLLEKEACILGLGSIAGHKSYLDAQNISLYSASKSALSRILMNWAKDNPDMTIFEIALGAVQTKMLEGCRPPHMSKKEWQEVLLQDIPIKEIGQPEPVAETILGLLKTPSYRLFHGTTVHLSGGENL